MADETHSVDLQLDTAALQAELDKLARAAERTAKRIERAFGAGAGKAKLLNDKLKSLQFDTKLLTQRFEGISKATVEEALSLGLLDRNMESLDRNISETVPGLVELDEALKDLASTKDVLPFLDAEETGNKLESITSKLRELEASKVISENQLEKALKRAEKQFAEVNPLVEDLKEAFDSLGDFARSNFRAIIRDSKDVNDALKDIGQTLLELAAETFIFNPLERGARKVFEGFADNLFSNIGSFFGGAREHGGPVTSGKAFLVGEQGPELFIPRNAGGIIPAGGFRQNGESKRNERLTPVFTVDMRGASLEAVPRLELFVRQINGSIETRAINAVANEMVRTR